MVRKTAQTEKRRQPIKESLKDGLPKKFSPIVDYMVDETRFTLKTLRVLSAFFDDLRPSPERSPETIMKWKRQTVDFFKFVEQEWNGPRVRTGVMLCKLRDYADGVGKKDKEFRFQLLFLAATIEASVSRRETRNEPEY